jgi:hypothetical protein
MSEERGKFRGMADIIVRQEGKRELGTYKNCGSEKRI